MTPPSVFQATPVKASLLGRSLITRPCGVVPGRAEASVTMHAGL